ncbi:MAG: oligoendopeptidase F [Caldilinea sp.]|nr:oligoendopeptidase F [Caldilineaceae bacterium]MCB9118999.1 oligoendopeptidase F [Caldilineaceae bacterium]MCB9126077.1 oligoendopeptidase F [Caldilineaceae bacterium]MCO5213859.1 oligoendopeptidase F [Caldilinea sp.]MCW5841508.1 oligoendopeptidase F [Caldilinea sp.]
MATATVPARNEIPVEHTWDLANIFPTPADWEAKLANVKARLPEIRQYQGRLGEGPDALAGWLETYQDLMRDTHRVVMYAALDYSTDTNNQAAAARAAQGTSLASAVQAAVSFAEPEMMGLGFATLRAWLADSPRLAIYAHYIDNLERMSAHVRSAEVEELLGQVEDPFRTAANTHGILTNSEIPFAPATSEDGVEQFEVTHGSLGALLSSPDRTVRRTAWESYADGHLAYKNTMANALAAGVKQDVFRARARRYDSSLEAALTPPNIPTAVFHNLIATFRKNLPTWHRYWRLRRKVLGVETLHEYDIKAPLASHIDVPYRQAVDWICEGMAPLGEEYVSILRRGALDERWVDIYPNKGKRLGAFSYGGPGTHPFIMMSYNDDVFSLSTLAHELGHSLHSYFSWRTQPMIYGRYTLFAAEVASNFNQALVRDYLLRTNPDRDFQIAVIEEAMSNFHRYFFIMPTLARFELELHERVERGQPLTSSAMIELMADLFAEGYGDDLVMDRERTGITWAEFSTHMYSNFYVYQYATGISGANALAAGVLAGADGAVERYLEFLHAGGALYPLDALQRAGVDLSAPEPVDAAFAVLADYVTRLEGLLL